jgi:hypothetical protein
VAGRAAAPAAGTWERLSRGQPNPGRFGPVMTAGLPEPACRWLTHAIVPGTPLARAVIVEMEGHIRLGRWLPFWAVQLHAPPDGYVWAARARLGPLRISGFDRFADGTGEMRWRLLGHIPVVNATGPDLDRSAAGRVALDAMLVPTAFLSPLVSWSDGPRPNSATAEWTVGARTLQTELRVGPDGELRSVVMPRWGNPMATHGASTRAVASSPARPASAGSNFQLRCGPGGSSIPITGPKASSSALRSPRLRFL